LFFSAWRRSSSTVMSASSCWVTCGMFSQAACRRGPEILRTRDSGLISTGPNFAKSTTGTAGKAGPVLTAPLITDFTNCLTSSSSTRPFWPEPFTRPRSTPSSRANLRTEGLAWARANVDSSIGGKAAADAGREASGVRPVGARRPGGDETGAEAGAEAGAGDGAGVRAGAGVAATAASSASTKAIRSPVDTRPPCATFISTSVPATGDGTSIAALSVSSVISVCSARTRSPALTRTSTISTLLKSPRSGTLISRRAMYHSQP
jgi:hypothetical protein